MCEDSFFPSPCPVETGRELFGAAVRQSATIKDEISSTITERVFCLFAVCYKVVFDFGFDLLRSAKEVASVNLWALQHHFGSVDVKRRELERRAIGLRAILLGSILEIFGDF